MEVLWGLGEADLALHANIAKFKKTAGLKIIVNTFSLYSRSKNGLRN